MKTFTISLVCIFSVLFSPAHSQQRWETPLDSTIAHYVSLINADSIQAYMQALENFGTRFCLAANRRDVAEWIMNKFLSFGYTNVVLDSFQFNYVWNGQLHQTWQHNVVCTKPGHVNPFSVYIMGAHHDAIVQSGGNPMFVAPGADDNASGVAAALEVARVMKSQNYQPDFTIKFITFAAEELGLHGAWHYADNAAASGMDIELMINNDMIGHTISGPPNWKVRIQKYPNSQWATSLAVDLIQEFTTLGVTESTQFIQYSDSWPFYYNGFSAIFFIEDQFNPWYHTINDLVVHTNKHYAAEMVKISMAMLINQNGVGTISGATQDYAVAHLLPVFPNPASYETTVQFHLETNAMVNITLYDALFRQVKVLVNGMQEAGTHRIEVKASDLPVGLYFCRLVSPGLQETIKLTIAR